MRRRVDLTKQEDPRCTVCGSPVVETWFLGRHCIVVVLSVTTLIGIVVSMVLAVALAAGS